jgi:hypothetical protein
MNLFESKVKILGGPFMAGSHVDGNFTEREPNIGRMKDQLVNLENIVEQMANAMCQPSEKVDHMEAKMGRMKHGFNQIIRECQESVM